MDHHFCLSLTLISISSGYQASPSTIFTWSYRQFFGMKITNQKSTIGFSFRVELVSRKPPKPHLNIPWIIIWKPVMLTMAHLSYPAPFTCVYVFVWERITLFLFNGITINEGLLSYICSHGLLYPCRENGCHPCSNSNGCGPRSRTLRLLTEMLLGSMFRCVAMLCHLYWNAALCFSLLYQWQTWHLFH